MNKMFPRIAIIGAGPAGLVAARILQLNDIECSVFERDASAIARTQGGVLDMHVEGGQFAFQACDLFEKFLGIARYDEQEIILYDQHGDLRLFQPTPSGADRPEVDRPDIRRILLDALKPETVRWEHGLKSLEQKVPGDPVALSFRNGSTETFDLVIGADGARSQVRPFLSEATPTYTGATFYELYYSGKNGRDAELLALTRKGNMFAMGDRQLINSHRTAAGGVHVYVGGWTGEVPGPEATRDDLAGRFKTWAPGLQRFLNLAEPQTSRRIIFELPVGHRWVHCPGITLIGDAAHLMSPFSGEGANLAMRDAADLALAIVAAIQQETDLSAAVAGIEELICARAEIAAVGASAGVREAFAADAIDRLAEEMRNHHEPELNVAQC